MRGKPPVDRSFWSVRPAAFLLTGCYGDVPDPPRVGGVVSGFEWTHQWTIERDTARGVRRLLRRLPPGEWAVIEHPGGRERGTLRLRPSRAWTVRAPHGPWRRRPALPPWRYLPRLRRLLALIEHDDWRVAAQGEELAATLSPIDRDALLDLSLAQWLGRDPRKNP